MEETPTRPPRIQLSGVVLGAPEPRTLAAFYRRLLGWEVADDQPHWVRLRPPGGGTGLSFQTEDNYEPPVWPPEPGSQQMMVHVDIGVDDVDQAVAWALALGARPAEHQPQEHTRVMFDPDGHPFCLFPLPS